MVRGAGCREINLRIRRREKNVLDIPFYRAGDYAQNPLTGTSMRDMPLRYLSVCDVPSGSSSGPPNTSSIAQAAPQATNTIIEAMNAVIG